MANLNHQYPEPRPQDVALNLADDLADLERNGGLSMVDVIAVADRHLDRWRDMAPPAELSIMEEFRQYEQLGLCRIQEYEAPELTLSLPQSCGSTPVWSRAVDVPAGRPDPPWGPTSCRPGSLPAPLEAFSPLRPTLSPTSSGAISPVP